MKQSTEAQDRAFENLQKRARLLSMGELFKLNTGGYALAPNRCPTIERFRTLRDVADRVEAIQDYQDSWYK